MTDVRSVTETGGLSGVHSNPVSVAVAPSEVMSIAHPIAFLTQAVSIPQALSISTANTFEQDIELGYTADHVADKPGAFL